MFKRVTTVLILLGAGCSGDTTVPSEPLVEPTAEPVAQRFVEFEGVAELPSTHPCHDSTKVAVFSDTERENGEWKDSMAITPLGEVRKKSDDWLYLGPRTVKGVRWSTPEADFLFATCNMTGRGFALFDAARHQVPDADVTFVLGDVGEPNDIEYADARWMRREKGGDWGTPWDTTTWAYSDEGNNAQFVARVLLLDASDSDGDGVPEITTMTVTNCRTTDKNCSSSAQKREFWVEIDTFEGADAWGNVCFLGLTSEKCPRHRGT